MSLTEQEISRQLHKAYQPGSVGSTDGYRGLFDGVELKCAAVLLPLVWWKEEWQLVFTRRTETVEHHKGQVSFPGGRCEVGESTPESTALRETQEEIGLNQQDVRLLGRLNDYITITHYRVTPVVGVIPWPYPVRLEEAEVERIFTIPLTWLADIANWDEQPVIVDGFARPFPVLRYHLYDGEILWGATARMVHNFLVVLGLQK
jgi:8-oxo-dGTP pyrophosphatase MutT (NUDIX family)